MSLRITLGQLLLIRRPALVLVVYAIATAVVYRSALAMAFTSDDFFFLDIVSRATTPLVIFEPLLGRFLRPLVVALYYFNYQAFGLTAWPYHVAALLPHLATGWLVYLVAGRLGGKDDTPWAFLAGLGSE